MASYETMESMIGDSYNTWCPICWEEFTLNSRASLLLPCKHMVCNECFVEIKRFHLGTGM